MLGSERLRQGAGLDTLDGGARGLRWVGVDTDTDVGVVGGEALGPQMSGERTSGGGKLLEGPILWHRGVRKGRLYILPTLQCVRACVSVYEFIAIYVYI